MLRSMYSGISGMKANQTKLDVIGNNIANSSTTAFKSQSTRFATALSQTQTSASSPSTYLGGVNGQQIGLGASVSSIASVMSNGSLQTTNRKSDVAIDGNGYFIVASCTTSASIPINNDNIGASNDGSSVYYTRDGSFSIDKEGYLINADGYRVMGYAVKGDGGTSLSYDQTNKIGKVSFVDGSKDVTAVDDNLVPLMIPQKIEGKDENGNTVEKSVVNYTIEKTGLINAVLSDGTVSCVGQIAMANFSNTEGLTRESGNLFSVSSNSGNAVAKTGINTLGRTDNSGSFGVLAQGYLEMSNVDLAEQFTDMIVASRAFQANSKCITTGDEILQQIIALKQ